MPIDSRQRSPKRADASIIPRLTAPAQHDRRGVKHACFDGHLVEPVDLAALEAVASSIDRSLPTLRPANDPAPGSGQLDG